MTTSALTPTAFKKLLKETPGLDTTPEQRERIELRYAFMLWSLPGIKTTPANPVDGQLLANFLGMVEEYEELVFALAYSRLREGKTQLLSQEDVYLLLDLTIAQAEGTLGSAERSATEHCLRIAVQSILFKFGAGGNQLKAFWDRYALVMRHAGAAGTTPLLFLSDIKHRELIDHDFWGNASAFYAAILELFQLITEPNQLINNVLRPKAALEGRPFQITAEQRADLVASYESAPTAALTLTRSRWPKYQG